MRRTISMSFLAAAVLFVTPPCCRGQAARTHLSTAEAAHRLMEITNPEDRRHLAFGDVELVLEFGTSHDAETLFRTIVNTSIHMRGATVVAAAKNWIRVAWDDGFNPSLRAFRFEFNEPLASLPVPGQKITLNGTYSSYSREPLLITMTNASISSQ